MMEVGPWKVDGNGGLKTVEGGWEEYTTMVYGAEPRSLVSLHPSLTICQSINPRGRDCRTLAQTTTYVRYKRYVFCLDCCPRP